jgi:hypothetical protein
LHIIQFLILNQNNYIGIIYLITLKTLLFIVIFKKLLFDNNVFIIIFVVCIEHVPIYFMFSSLLKLTDVVYYYLTLKYH